MLDDVAGNQQIEGPMLIRRHRFVQGAAAPDEINQLDPGHINPRIIPVFCDKFCLRRMIDNGHVPAC